MPYRIDRGLFVENGPTILAEDDRQRRAAGQAYRLLAAARPASSDAREATLLNRAA